MAPCSSPHSSGRLQAGDFSPDSFPLHPAASDKRNTGCPVPDPAWLTALLASGCELQLEDIVVQAGRHFSDAVNRSIFAPDTTKRQAATAVAWTIVSMVRSFVDNDQLFVRDPVDSDVKRICSEVLGVGIALELLRANSIIDGRTIRKLGESFDYEAYGPNGGGRINIEAKGTFNDASTSEHRRSIANKIASSSGPRGYDRAIGIIASLWTEGSMRTFDVEICDPERIPRRRSRAAIREVIRFCARRFDEAVGIPEGTKTLFSIAADRHLFDTHPPAMRVR